ncbi:hypothetical protein QFC19_004595 [Naganishia cerealis]|uniref:Uncharacterized protein n=1 Tax=Naganishia cerealis TaxID=610337 RepID=A0ACC2VVF2_9TREE|nr:hypothetical protein QFC19_004595 [Naganishia cerealis]
MDQFPPPGPPPSFHLRLTSALACLTILDAAALTYCYSLVMGSHASSHASGGGGVSGSAIFFGTEFAILLTTSLSIIAKYGINVVDLLRTGGRDDAPPWEGKRGVARDARNNTLTKQHLPLRSHSDAIKLIIYTAFFYTIFLLSGVFPINHIVPLYLTFRAFTSKCLDLKRYRQATRNMDARYPDATQEEIDGLGGGSCVICREEMRTPTEEERSQSRQRGAVNETPKKLACGHVFHFHCLRSWLERQQSCPTCRRTVFDTTNNRPAAAAPAPQPAQAPVPPPTAQATAAPAATAAATTAQAEMTTRVPRYHTPINHLHPIGIWQSERLAATLGVSPLLQDFRQRIVSDYTRPGPVPSHIPVLQPAAAPIDIDNRPTIHVAPPTTEQASAFRALPWEALTIAERQRAIRGQKTEAMHGITVNPSLEEGLPHEQEQEVQQQARNLMVATPGSETPLASHTPLSSQAPEVFSEIHAERVRTRSMARSMARSSSNADTTGLDAQDSPDGGVAGGPTPAQMAAMAALRRANSHRRSSANLGMNTYEAASYAVQPTSPPAKPQVSFGNSEAWAPDTAFPFPSSAQNNAPLEPAISDRSAAMGMGKGKNYLVPLFTDPARAAQTLPHPLRMASSPLSPRSVIASLRWSTDQLKRSVQDGSSDQWIECRPDLAKLDREIAEILSDLGQARAKESTGEYRAEDVRLPGSVEGQSSVEDS